LFADYNCLTTAEGLLSAGKENERVTFDMFFREIPDKGGFAVMAGLGSLCEKLNTLSFDEDFLNYLSGQGFSEKLIEYFRDFEFSCDVYAMPEGTPVFPNEPIVKVSGGGGFYVEGSVNELEKDKLTIGQEVTVNDWRSGMTYTGTVESIGDFPVQDGWNGMGNPNASYYPFKVFIDGSADLQAGNHVSVVYSASQGEHGIYLQNPFVRTEQGKSYVFILGSDGKLEKRYVTTGKSLWGSYTEIISGLTEEDLIAFPYGKNVKPGVAAQEGDLSNLYG
jgi:hypothetical protein